MDFRTRNRECSHLCARLGAVKGTARSCLGGPVGCESRRPRASAAWALPGPVVSRALPALEGPPQGCAGSHLCDPDNRGCACFVLVPAVSGRVRGRASPPSGRGWVRRAVPRELWPGFGGGQGGKRPGREPWALSRHRSPGEALQRDPAGSGACSSQGSRREAEPAGETGSDGWQGTGSRVVGPAGPCEPHRAGGRAGTRGHRWALPPAGAVS